MTRKEEWKNEYDKASHKKHKNTTGQAIINTRYDEPTSNISQAERVAYMNCVGLRTGLPHARAPPSRPRQTRWPAARRPPYRRAGRHPCRGTCDAIAARAPSPAAPTGAPPYQAALDDAVLRLYGSVGSLRRPQRRVHVTQRCARARRPAASAALQQRAHGRAHRAADIANPMKNSP